MYSGRMTRVVQERERRTRGAVGVAEDGEVGARVCRLTDEVKEPI
jgi:hypothetical protein